MASGSDKVEKSMDTVVAEAWVTLDSRLLGQNVVVLALEVPNNLREAGLVVNLVTEARGVDDGQ